MSPHHWLFVGCMLHAHPEAPLSESCILGAPALAGERMLLLERLLQCTRGVQEAAMHGWCVAHGVCDKP
jgi:hypothetical protein